MTRSGQRWLSSSRTTVACGHSASKSRRFLAAAPRRRWIAWSSSPAALTWPCSPASSRSSRPWAKFASCSSSTSTWRKRVGDPRAHARLGAQQAEGVEHEVAEVARARLLQPAVVGGVDGGELALAVGLGAERLRPRAVVLVRDELVLEAVDAGDDRAEQLARVAADVVRGERQLVDPLEQHREAVRGRDRRRERVEPCLERLVVQDVRAEAVDGGDGELLEAAVERRLQALAQAVGGGLGDGQREDRLGREPCSPHQPARSARTARSSCRCRRRRGRAAGRPGA